MDFSDNSLIDETPVSGQCRMIYLCLFSHKSCSVSYTHLRITNSILGEDEIADSASPELASIRRHMRAAEAKVRDILQLSLIHI